jgi:hypothetical protein
MKTFTKMAAQGDFMIISVADIPSVVERIMPENGMIIVAHSETGHNHVMVMDHVEAYKEKGVRDVDLYKMFLNVSKSTEITHLRSFDTHETLLVPPGKYEIRRQREYMAEGFRRAAD